MREYVFREPYNLCVLTERRVFHPFGLMGGESGAKGKNTLVKKDGRHINLGSKSRVDVETGVREREYFIGSLRLTSKNPHKA